MLTLFAPLGMAEDLTKIQFTLCNEIKTKLQAVKESVAAIPFSDLQKKIVETTTSLEERMCGLEDKYNELKEMIIHRTTQPYNLDPSLLREVGLYNHGAEVQPLDQHKISAKQICSRQC